MQTKYPITQYPTGDVTDPNVLQASLGSFWNIVFRETTTITGYCEGLAEELYQTYLNLIEAVSSFGVSQEQVLSSRKWYPLVVKLSQLNNSPLLFEPNEAVFGPQPTTDPFYAGITFKFGGTKSPSQNVWTVAVPTSFTDFSVIANRVMVPSTVYVNNVDVTLQNSVLYFNSDPFEDLNNTTYPIINEQGVPATFTDDNGNVQQDRFMVLWCYRMKQDNQNVTNNFGYIFGLNLPSTDQSKQIIKALFSLSVGGATPSRLKTMIATLSGIPVIIENQETIELVYQDSTSQIVVTDQHVYRFDFALNLLPTAIPGGVFYTGDVLVDAIQYFDSSVLPRWWDQVFKGWKSVPFSSNVFLGSYKFQLSFSTALELVTLSEAGVLNFPVQGLPGDVAAFNAMLNNPDRLPDIVSGFGLSTNPSTYKPAVPIIPSQWLFQNFFKDNMGLLYINLPSSTTTSYVADFMDIVRPLLPPHVFLMQQITFNFPEDIYDQLNDCYLIPALSATPFNADGSDRNGFIANEAPYYFNNLPTRLFVVAKAPMIDTTPLADESNYDVVSMNSIGDAQAVCRAAKVFTHIPDGATTRTVRTLSIVDFS